MGLFSIPNWNVAPCAESAPTCYQIADVSVTLSLGMTVALLAICMVVVWWIFKTGYRLKT